MSTPDLKQILEAALFAAGRPLNLDEMLALFAVGDLRPERAALRDALVDLASDWEGRGIELVEVASGHRFQVRKELGEWMAPLWAERPPRYSRALLETLALVAYRQPITRAEIEEVRGVSVSSSIVKTLMERDWIRVLGHREVPGRPALYGTTREFLDAFGLKKLEDLPPLSELKDLDQVHEDLFSGMAGASPAGEAEPGDGDGGSGEPDAGVETEGDAAALPPVVASGHEDAGEPARDVDTADDAADDLDELVDGGQGDAPGEHEDDATADDVVEATDTGPGGGPADAPQPGGASPREDDLRVDRTGRSGRAT